MRGSRAFRLSSASFRAKRSTSFRGRLRRFIIINALPAGWSPGRARRGCRAHRGVIGSDDQLSRWPSAVAARTCACLATYRLGHRHPDRAGRRAPPEGIRGTLELLFVVRSTWTRMVSQVLLASGRLHQRRGSGLYVVPTKFRHHDGFDDDTAVEIRPAREYLERIGLNMMRSAGNLASRTNCAKSRCDHCDDGDAWRGGRREDRRGFRRICDPTISPAGRAQGWGNRFSRRSGKPRHFSHADAEQMIVAAA